ncbi:MAG: hypothetical protein WC279_04005 [Sulfurimonas sp.]|jgi:hypothetical protein|uniref:hypothetical protein n=1 Tax=unclassified Sulfurimonas TaxID=2623549 RepID=UPI0008B528A0|nr:hypothetical protein [Sulfurimonas sp. RIFOXYB12_FULL_35_9]OHE05716.1 MAG: hypothetical protein A2345_00770 [Sulfurimonas sp. RIFOXYB12_FULL_35_9]
MKDKLYNEYFGIKSTSFKKHDVFNGFVNRDALYYMLPYEFENIQIDEFKNSYEKYKQYFSNIITILDQSNGDDIFYRKAEKKFQFHELGHIGLGYSITGKNGSGIGKIFASKLTQTAFQFVKAGIKNPEIFLMVGLIEEKIGPDRISDMTAWILQEDFLLYTQRVSLELKLKTKKFTYSSTVYNLPFNPNNEPIIFCPRSVLTDLPVAFDADDIDRVCIHNSSLRDRVNEVIGQVFDKQTRAFIKRNFKNLILNNPSIIEETIKTYKDKGKNYDFDNDPKGDFIWKEIASDVVQNNSLTLIKQSRPIDIVNAICDKYQDLIENNGMWKFFHNSDGTHKQESFAQMLFFAIAHSYCETNNLDISPETNSGNGPIDFKISQGFNDKINIEMKLSTNTKLLHGYKSQLAIYNKAEKTNQSKFVIVQLYDKDSAKIEKVYEYKRQNETLDNKLPDIVVIDATKRESASKR